MTTIKTSNRLPVFIAMLAVIVLLAIGGFLFWRSDAAPVGGGNSDIAGIASVEADKALSKAGMKPTNSIDMTGKLPETGPDSLPSVLGRLDEMGGKPSDSIPIRENSDWNSPARELVGLPNE